MPTAVANGKEFTFPEGTTPEQMGRAIDSYFASRKGLPQAPDEAPSQGVGELVTELVTGEDRSTDQTQNLPEVFELSGLLAGEDQGVAARIAPALVTATDPNEVAQIITSNFPNVGLTFNRDAQGNPFPILVNNRTGAAAVVNRPGLSSTDIIQTLGLASLFSPGGGLRMVATIGKDVATETAIQGNQAAQGGNFDESDIALAAITAGAAKTAEAAATIPARISRGQSENEVVTLGQEFDVDTLTTDVVAPDTFAGKASQQIGEKVPVVGTGGRRAEQQRQREDAVTRLVEEYGEFDYGVIVDSLKNQKDARKKAAGDALQRVGAQLDELGEIPFPKSAEAIEDAQKLLSDPRMIKSNAALSDLNTLLEALTDPNGQTFTTLKQNRTAFREVVNGADRADRSQLPSRAKSILMRLERALGDDMDSFAKANLSADDYAGWRKANSDYAAEAKELTKTKLKNVLDSGEARPSVVANMLLRSDPKEMRLLASNLDEEGRRHARAAVVSHVVEKASRAKGGLTPNSFANELKKVQPSIDAFFEGEQKRQLLGLRKLLDATRRAQDSAASTPTGQQLIPLFFGATTGAEVVATGGIPFATTIGTVLVGGLAQAYESTIVRESLLRLASIPRGSSGYDRAVAEALSAVRSVGTAALNSQPEQETQSIASAR